ncbi:hypothetical protein J0H58_19895 [bacterium]|nr:hypothetical protein [bacterium]
MWDPPAEHPLRRLFTGLTEHAFFSYLGVADPPLTDYLSSLLSRFVHFDTVHRLPGSDGRPLTELVGMVLEAEQLPPGGRMQREFYRHVGDFALFWTGVYPEALNRTRARGGRDALVDYTTQGKRGYLLTSRMDASTQPGDADLFRRLSEQFEVCAVGLREVRREWEERRPDLPPGTPLIG